MPFDNHKLLCHQQTALAPLTDVHEVEGIFKETIWMTTRTALVTMMRSWTVGISFNGCDERERNVHSYS
jgi:hypothetical protein